MIISYDKIKKYKNLSSSQLEAFNFKNKNIFKLSQLLYRNLQTSDNGIEVGSINYIKKSEKIFMKAKALQAYNYLPVINAETSEFIKPNCFVNMELLAGDIILSKDSNIGEACILDKDYSNVGNWFNLKDGSIDAINYSDEGRNFIVGVEYSF